MRLMIIVRTPIRPLALILLFLASAMAMPGRSAAQSRHVSTSAQFGTPVEIGTRVRVYWTGRRPMTATGRMLSADSETIAVRSEPDGRVVRVPPGAVDALQVSLGPETPGRAAWKAAVPALAVGAMFTSILAVFGHEFDTDECHCGSGALPVALKVGVGATTIAAGLRAARAYASPGQRWRTVSPPLVVLPAKTAMARDTLGSTTSP
jgi:hypothetical protein